MSQRISRLARLAAALAVAGVATAAQAVTEIQWWHAMTGANNDRVNNARQALQRKPERIQGQRGLQGQLSRGDGRGDRRVPRRQRAAHPAGVRGRHGDDDGGQGRDQAGVRGDGEAGEKFDPKAYVPAVAGYYTNTKGQMLSFPFNSSTTVFWYNKDAFEKAGLDPEPRAADVARGRRGDGQAEGVGPRVPVHDRLADVDAARELLGVAQRAVRSPRRTASPASTRKLVFNGPVQVRHIENMQDWIKKGYFVYGGRKNEPEAKFYSGECAMMTTSSAAYGTIKQNAKFKFGVVDAAVLRRRRRARRRTRSSAARACG